MDYFKRKEDLAAACYFRTIEQFKHMAQQALNATSAGRDPLLVSLQAYFDLAACIHRGEVPPLMLFDELLTLQGEHAEAVFAAYGDMYLTFRAAVSAGKTGQLDRLAPNAIADYLLSQLLWVPAWIGRYQVEEFPQLALHEQYP